MATKDICQPPLFTLKISILAGYTSDYRSLEVFIKGVV